MAPRLTAAIAVGAATCIAIAGCGDGETQGTGGPDSPASYVAAVEGLVEPPALLAAEISRGARGEGPAAGSRRRLDGLVSAARARLAALRALRLEDPGLRRRRDRLASAYAGLVPRMEAAADALAGGDRAALTAAAAPFLDALRTLPSAASPSSSR
jgi:hypothetical protein